MKDYDFYDDEKPKKERKKTPIFLTILSFSTLLVAIVGATFAYFTATIAEGDKGSIIKVQSVTLQIIYHDGNDISIDGIEPGWTATKTITIENPTKYPAAYTFRWKSGLFNNFANKDELIYSVTCTGSSAPGPITNTPLPGDDPALAYPINIFVDKVIPANSNHVCEIRFEFIETSSNQNYNQTSEFIGSLELLAEDETSS